MNTDEIQQIWQFALLGLGIGALIAGIALAVVLFYRGSGVINLASGGIAMFAGYTYWALRTGLFGPDISTAPALVITFGVIVVFAVAMELLAFRPLQAASPLAKLAASLGVLLTLQASMLVAFEHAEAAAACAATEPAGGDLRSLRRARPLTDGGDRHRRRRVLAALYRWTRFGLATRAASEDEVSATLAGLSPNSLSMVNTILGCLVAGGLGVLAASITVLYWQTLPLYIVPALAAASSRDSRRSASRAASGSSSAWRSRFFSTTWRQSRGSRPIRHRRAASRCRGYGISSSSWSSSRPCSGVARACPAAVS